MNTRALILALSVLCCAAPVAAAPVATPHVDAELVAEHTSWLAGSTNWVALRLKPDPGWHTYWRNPGDSGLPTTLTWALPEGWTAGDIAWPFPSTHRLGELVNYGYDGQTLHLVPLESPADQDGEVTIKALATWLVCSDICIPGQAELSLTLPVAEIATADPIWSPRFLDARARLPRPEPLAGTFQVAGGEVRLQVDASVLAGASRVEFFAYANDLVNHGAPQRVAHLGSSARFAQPQSAYFKVPEATVEGVLVVHAVEGRAYTVIAAPGEVATVAPPAPAVAAKPREDPAGLWLTLGFALLGGLILNLMPCVFPVLAIKAVSVLESRRGDAAAERLHALAYTGGVVLSCVAAAAAIVLLRAGGEQLGWGFQLQAPVFVGLLAYVMLALGLSLSGVVQFGTRLMGVGQQLAKAGRLRQPGVLTAQVRRMLADDRSDSLVHNFVGQWLQLRNLESKVRPDILAFPNFDDNVREAFRRETEMLFAHILRENRTILELLNADYTFVNERLARHYGIPGVYGTRFREVKITDPNRRGLLGHGSILSMTSVASRTSPVFRGKYVLSTFLNTPPPPPLPNVPTLEESETDESAPKTVRQLLERHRNSPNCASCHRVIDPVGFALEGFNPVGQWRETDADGKPLDTEGVLADGSKVDGPIALRDVILSRPEAFATTLTERVMTYALGRGVQPADMPVIRGIVRRAAREDYRFGSIIMGIVESAPFQMRTRLEPADTSTTVADANAKPFGSPGRTASVEQP
jgi:DsbC/DsbD-like thiol-disulfide interchange protein